MATPVVWAGELSVGEVGGIVYTLFSEIFKSHGISEYTAYHRVAAEGSVESETFSDKFVVDIA